MEPLKPVVFKKSGGQRLGKGFSLGELEAVGLNPKQAVKLGIPVDARRKTAHEENIEKLRRFLEAIKEDVKHKSEKTSKKAEEKKGKLKEAEK
jgi:large subunit ribosomal protein L13e